MKDKRNKSKIKKKISRNTNEDNTVILNGPINYFKLSNGSCQINIFMDYHAPITRQKKCPDYESKDIDKYFNKLLSTNFEASDDKNTLDFFLEINPTSINFQKKYYTNDNYLTSIRQVFSKLYSEKYSNFNESELPKQNIRLHYMDIRDYSSFNQIKYKLDSVLSELHNTKLDNLTLIIHELTSVKNILLFLNEMIISIIEQKNTIYSSLSTKKIDFINLKELPDKTNEMKTSNVHKPNNTDSNVLDENMLMDVALYQILQKILSNYKKNDNRDNIVDLFTSHYIKTSHYVINKLNKLIQHIIDVDKIIDEYIVDEKITFEEINFDKNDGSRDIAPYYFFSMTKYKQFWRDIVDDVEEINHLVIKMGVIMTDCYFLRRLIDNSNIKKSIIYTGAYHSVVYLWFLIKYNHYNIDDYYYLNDNITSEKLVKIIKKSDYLDIMQYVIPTKINQCIKIKEL